MQGRRTDMDYRKELNYTFDTAVSLYDRMRPGYVDELYGAVFEYIGRAHV